MIHAVLFDGDGTLFDLTSVYDEVSESFFGSVSRLGRDAYLRLVVGRPFAEWVIALANEAGVVVTPKLLLDVRDAIEAQLPDVCRPVPRLVRMMRRLVGDELNLAVVTNNTVSLTLLALSYVDIRENLNAIVCGEDGSPKPAPDLWLLAAQELGASPQDCLAVEDTSEFLDAPRKAGMLTLCTSYATLCYEEVHAQCEASR